MPTAKASDLAACEREPIHIPGAIQPHGLLIVVDLFTDEITQAAGDLSRLAVAGSPVLGQTMRLVVGLSLENLVRLAETPLLPQPTCLGTVVLEGAREWTVVAHSVGGEAIVEFEPSARTVPTAKTVARIQSITERLGQELDDRSLYGIAAEEVHRTTGYDRVMIYQFLADGSGSVLAEIKVAGQAPFLNHRFPGSDIPKQARELYKRNTVRVIPDVSYVPLPVSPSWSRATNQPLDMSNCLLRSVSPVHIRYLQNMGVGASMSISLVADGELWGLIACHNATPKHVSYEDREVCRHVGQTLSQQIRARRESDSYRVARELASARDKVMHALIGVDDPAKLLLARGPDLQEIVPSHGVAILSKDAVATAGYAPNNTEVREIGNWLKETQPAGEVFATDSLSTSYAGAATFQTGISGLLSIVLPGDDLLTLMWFRAEQVEEVNWAGNPHQHLSVGANGVLNPRHSFATWRETVRGQARPWQPVEIDSVRGFGPRVAFVLQQRKVRELNEQLEAANDRLAALASTDGLTGVANRRAFDERLTREWTRVNRPRRQPAMIMVDLDFFKQYNDQYGHVMGDESLRLVAKVLSENRRSTDLVARMGGEEFSLFLPDTDLEGAIKVAESLRARVEGLQRPHAKSPFGVVTASFGVAVATTDGKGPIEGLLQAADAALYQAKNSGRNRVAVD